MTTKDKELLLKELCARLPYYTMVLMGDGGVELLVSVNVDTGICNGLKGLPKPYLRPMSSMTDNEKKIVHYYVESHKYGNCSRSGVISDYLNSIHVDYCGLIEKGLALEAPEGMYKTE